MLCITCFLCFAPVLLCVEPFAIGKALLYQWLIYTSYMILLTLVKQFSERKMKNKPAAGFGFFCGFFFLLLLLFCFVHGLCS